MTPSVANRPDLLAAVQLRTAPALPVRDPRFAPVPAELCQLAGVWNPDTPLRGKWIAEEKIDGFRALYFDGQLWSREGNPLTWAAHCLPDLQRLERRYGEPVMLDGEYMEPGGFLDTVAVASARGRRPARGTLHLFDAVPLAHWRANACPLPLAVRRRLLAVALGDWLPPTLRLVNSRPVTNAADAIAMARGIWAEGGEGIMLKREDAPYTRARSTDWLKYKRRLSLTGRVLEVIADGAALRVEIGGRAVKVAASPPLRLHTPAVGMHVTVQAMEWTKTAQLRQGIAMGICDPA